jgi:hypothetical protein
MRTGKYSTGRSPRALPKLHDAEEQALVLERVARRLRLLERKLGRVVARGDVHVVDRRVARRTRRFVASIAGRIERRAADIRKGEAAWRDYVNLMTS